MGLPDWALESARSPISREKARPNFPLKFRLNLKLGVGRRIQFRAHTGPEEIEVALKGVAAADRNLKRLETRVTYLYPSSLFAVLNDRVVQLQFFQRRDDVIRAVTFVKDVAQQTEFPIFTRIVNQGRFREHALETALIRKKPNEAAAW